jgi:hypothetical protein
MFNLTVERLVFRGVPVRSSTSSATDVQKCSSAHVAPYGRIFLYRAADRERSAASARWPSPKGADRRRKQGAADATSNFRD